MAHAYQKWSTPLTPLRGHFFLEASAGTGKTFTIEQLVVRLLITEPVMTIDQILVVTFTRAATRELRARIYETLRKYLAEWQGDETTFLRLERASVLIHEAPIYTIHAFCMKMLSAYAFEAGLSLEPLAEEEDPEVFLDVLRSLQPYEEFSPQQLLLLLQKQGKEISKLRRALKGASLSQQPSFKELWQQTSLTKEEFDNQHQSNPQETLSRLARHVSSKMRLSPDAFLTMMESSLECVPFVEKIRGRFQAAIVDEFQDTDPAQWNILHKLFIEKPLPFLCLVGDPKQSIYAFRKADLKTFVKARDLFTPYILSTNYRSHPDLIEALNWLFDEKSRWLGPDISYIPVQSRENYPLPPLNDGKGSLHFLLTKGHKGRARKWPTEQMETSLLFPKIAHEIQSLGIPYGDIAILVKDRFQERRLSQYLQNLSIPTMTKNRGNLLETRGFTLFYNFLRENPGASWHIIETWIDSFSTTEHYQDLMQLAEIFLEEGDLIFKDPEEDPRLKRRSNVDGTSVQIMTTHAAKGLEFDVVFALGLASRHQEESSLEQEEEKMRLLYVALTRAKRRAYVPFCESIDDKKRLSPIELFFSRLLPKGDVRQFLKTSGKSISCEELQGDSPSATTSPAPPSLVAPPLVEIPVSSITTQSFSSLHQQHTFSSAEASSLPKGAEVGNFFHSLFETLLSSGRLDDEALMTREIEKSPFTPWKEEILTLVKGALSLPLDGFTLRDVSPAHMLQEMEFLFTEGTIRWKGFADLVFFHQGYYYLLDWKLHVLSDYRPETLEKTMQNYGYKEQAALYTKALRKLVPQGELGGAFYVFVRGLSVYKIKNTL